MPSCSDMDRKNIFTSSREKPRWFKYMKKIRSKEAMVQNILEKTAGEEGVNLEKLSLRIKKNKTQTIL